MCFNPFGGKRWPIFGSESKTKNSKLQDRAEDVSFEEVRESTKEQPKIDNEARTKQLSIAVEERTKELMKKDPMVGVLAITVFVHGAHWADEHPMSDYRSRAEWISAQHDEISYLLAKAGNSKDYLFEAILFATFADGANWANDNPAPTL